MQVYYNDTNDCFSSIHLKTRTFPEAKAEKQTTPVKSYLNVLQQLKVAEAQILVTCENIQNNPKYNPVVLTVCSVLAALLEVFIGVPADQGVLGVVVNRNTRPVLQVVHTLTRSTKRQSAKRECL